MRVLALDLATKLGFCFGTDADGVIEHGSYKLPSTGADIGKFLFAYRNWLDRALSVYLPDELVFEMPILPSTANLGTLRKLYSLCGFTELLCQDRHVAVREANLSDIRRHFVGVVRAPNTIPRLQRRKWLKDLTVTKCSELGFRTEDDNDADALALFSYVMASTLTGFVMAGSETARAA